MKTQHSYLVYTTDGSGFVKVHLINKGLWTLVSRWIDSCSMLTEIAYESLKSVYEFEHNITLPYYY